MSGSDKVYTRLIELGIDKNRLAVVMKSHDNWGGMVNAFEYLAVLGTVLTNWPDEVTKEEFDAAKGPGKTDDDGKDVLYRRMEEAHEHEWVRGCLNTTCTDCLMVCRVCRAVQK